MSSIENLAITDEQQALFAKRIGELVGPLALDERDFGLDDMEEVIVHSASTKYELHGRTVFLGIEDNNVSLGKDRELLVVSSLPAVTVGTERILSKKWSVVPEVGVSDYEETIRTSDTSTGNPLLTEMVGDGILYKAGLSDSELSQLMAQVLQKRSPDRPTFTQVRFAPAMSILDQLGPHNRTD